MKNMYKKGTLLSYKPYEHTDKYFVVCVTGKGEEDVDFKGIVVAAGKDSPWEIGHNSKAWSKDDFWCKIIITSYTISE